MSMRTYSPCPSASADSSVVASDCGATSEHLSRSPSLCADTIASPTYECAAFPDSSTDESSGSLCDADADLLCAQSVESASVADDCMPELLDTASVAVHGVQSTNQMDEAVRFAKRAVHDDPDSVHVMEEAHVFGSRILLLKLAGYGVTAPSKAVRGGRLWLDRAHTEIRTPARSAVLNARYVAKVQGRVVTPPWSAVLSDFVAPLLRAMGGAAAGVVRVHQPRSPWNGKVRCGQVFISFRDEHSAEAALAAIRAHPRGSLDVGGIRSSIAVSYFSADDKGAGQIGSGVSCSAAEAIACAARP